MCMDKSSSLIQHLKQGRIQRNTGWMSISRGKDEWIDELFSSLCLGVLSLPFEGLWYGEMVLVKEVKNSISTPACCPSVGTHWGARFGTMTMY